MKVTYNDIPMRLLEINEYSREAVYDPSNTDLLYLTHRLNVSVEVFPNGYPVGLAQRAIPSRVEDEMRSVRLGIIGGAQGAVKAFIGKKVDAPEYDGPKAESVRDFGDQPGFVTDKIIAYRLGLPRKHLKVSAYHWDGTEYVWLESPRPGFLTDSTNGPHVLCVNPGAPSGEGTSLTLNFQIETSIPPVDIEAERPILSHRWATEISHDDNYYPTRTVKGLVVFNAAVINNYPWNPDSFRNQLFHPIPLGYRRGLGPVLFDPSGMIMTYEFHDTLVNCVFDPANTGATMMEIVEDVYFKSPLSW